jgi:hypothetical protein
VKKGAAKFVVASATAYFGSPDAVAALGFRLVAFYVTNSGQIYQDLYASERKRSVTLTGMLYNRSLFWEPSASSCVQFQWES